MGDHYTRGQHPVIYGGGDQQQMNAYHDPSGGIQLQHQHQHQQQQQQQQPELNNGGLAAGGGRKRKATANDEDDDDEKPQTGKEGKGGASEFVKKLYR